MLRPRILHWLAPAAVLLLSPALADEATNLLGNVPMTGAVRRIIDDRVAAPVTPAAKGPGIGAGGDEDDDLVKGSGFPSLDKLRMERQRILGSARSAADAATQAGVASPLDIHGGRLEAQSTSHLADNIQAKIDSAAPPAVGVPALRRIPIDESGAATSGPVIKPSGFHVLDVVNEMQKPPAPGAAGVDTVLDVLKRLDASPLPEPSIPATTKIPVSPVDRLKEVQTSLADLAKILPDGPRVILDNVTRAIAPEFVTGIAAKAKSDGPQSADILAKLTEIDTDINAVTQAPEASSFDAGLKALSDLQKLDPSPAAPVNFDSVLNDLRKRAADPGDIDAPKWNALLEKLQGLGEKNVSIQTLQDLQELLQKPSAELATDVPAVGTPDIAGKDVPAPRTPSSESVGTQLDQIASRVTQGVSPVRARIDTALNGATAKVKDSIGGALGQVSDKINDSLDKAFSQLKTVCVTEGDKHAKSASDLASQANGTNVPAISYEDCNCRRCGDCLWLSECCCSRCPTADSVKANADAQAKKDALDAQAKAEKDQADKFYGAADQVMQQKNEIEANLSSIFSGVNTQVADIDLAGGDSSEEDGSTSGSGTTTRRRPSNPHGNSLVDNTSLLDKFLAIEGASIRTLQVSESVNAAVGANAFVEQRIATVGGGAGGKTIAGITDTDISIGSVNAGIGYNSFARQVVSSLGTLDENESLGPVTATRTIAAPINVSIGGNTLAEQRIASIDGSAPNRVNMTSVVGAPVNAAVGYSSTAVMEIGNLDGSVATSADVTTTSLAPVNATIGGQSSSIVRLGNLGPNARVGGAYSNSLVQPAGTVSVSLGVQSASLVSMGNVDGSVGGSASVSVNTGPAISAAIGGSTRAINRVGELAPDARVGGSLNIAANTGLLTTFALGYNTTASNEVAVIDAPVSGSASISVNVGELVTGTVGANTAASAIVGSVKAPVYGNADISVNAGGINTFAIGLSNDRTISSQTFIGNVFQRVDGPARISVNTGGVFTLGFGLVITIPVLGTLDFSHDGCTQIGNIGSRC